MSCLNRTFTDVELRSIAVRLAEVLRSHPEVDGGVSVRATLSFIEVLDSMRLLGEAITVQALYDAAMSTFAGRLRPKGWRSGEEIVKEALDEVLFGGSVRALRVGGDGGADARLRSLVEDLMRLSVAHRYGPPVKDEAKAGVYPRDLARLGRMDGDASTLQTLRDALRSALAEAAQRGASPSEAVREFLRSLEEFNIVRRDPNSGGGRHRFTRGAAGIVGEREAREILREYYEELIDKNSDPEVGEGIPRGDLARLLSELEALLDLMRSGRFIPPVQTIMEFYGTQLPTLSRVLSKLARTRALQQPHRSQDGGSALDDMRALLKALEKEQYIESDGQRVNLSTKAYELIFEDVLPEVDKATARGEHEALSGGCGDGEVVDVRRYRRGDGFRDLAVGATVRELVKKRRLQPDAKDLRANQLLPRRFLDIALAIDSSRSMAPYSKLLYAKKAAVGLALAAARRGDRVAVLAFSDFAAEVVGFGEGAGRRLLRSIARLRPLNSTNVEDAIRKATEVLNRQSMGGQKHMILVTDGVPTSCTETINTYAYPPYSYYWNYSRGIAVRAAYSQARLSAAKGVTISTICIDRGEHVDREFCLRLSRLGRGRAYFLRDEQRLLKTVLQEYSRARSLPPA